MPHIRGGVEQLSTPHRFRHPHYIQAVKQGSEPPHVISASGQPMVEYGNMAPYKTIMSR
jgi:hypothetical protein